MHYDLCLPWYWEYDIDFVQMIEHACYENGLALWQITPENLLESITALYKGENSFRAILDRSQYDTRFEPIHRWSREHAVQRFTNKLSGGLQAVHSRHGIIALGEASVRVSGGNLLLDRR